VGYERDPVETRTELYPPTEPYDFGMLDVGDGQLVYWEACGNPGGKPALFVHGGPGQGCTANMGRAFDPDRYRFVLFDQRGCGRSTPNASDPAVDLRTNTTDYLVRDMEQLREHLGISRWLLCGGSWGSTLILAYAQRHPERVTEIVISAVTTSRRSEIDWLYRGARRFFPGEWDQFRAGVPEADCDGDLLVAYGRRLADTDPQVRYQAASNWMTWEDAVLSLEPNARASSEGPPTDAMVTFARLCAHYYSHAAWLEEGELIRNAGRLAAIPGVLIHGRLDLSCPLDTAWELARAWPDAELVAPADSGHRGSVTKRLLLLAALDKFAPR
jgi:proline iminopeptidase